MTELELHEDLVNFYIPSVPTTILDDEDCNADSFFDNDAENRAPPRQTAGNGPPQPAKLPPAQAIMAEPDAQMSALAMFGKERRIVRRSQQKRSSLTEQEGAALRERASQEQRTSGIPRRASSMSRSGGGPMTRARAAAIRVNGENDSVRGVTAAMRAVRITAPKPATPAGVRIARERVRRSAAQTGATANGGGNAEQQQQQRPAAPVQKPALPSAARRSPALPTGARIPLRVAPPSRPAAPLPAVARAPLSGRRPASAVAPGSTAPSTSRRPVTVAPRPAPAQAAPASIRRSATVVAAVPAAPSTGPRPPVVAAPRRTPTAPALRQPLQVDPAQPPAPARVLTRAEMEASIARLSQPRRSLLQNRDQVSAGHTHGLGMTPRRAGVVRTRSITRDGAGIGSRVVAPAARTAVPAPGSAPVTVSAEQQ